MGKFMKFAKSIRNNWKKSTFGALALSYGVNYGKNSYDTKQMMREYCEFASRYGDITQPVFKPLRHITVVLNPAADKRRSKAQFDKYCAPLFHLAGLAVTVVQTEYAGQAKDLPESLDPKTNAIVIAGGDGTLSETVTGLLRRAGGNTAALKDLPLGVLPLGRTNSVAQALLGDREEVQALVDATLAVIDGSVKPVDVIKIEPIQDEGEEAPKAIYCVSGLEWGCHRDVNAKRDKYWYFGGLRDYVSYVWSTPHNAQWSCTYTDPCAGCCKCAPKKATSSRRWWSVFLPKKQETEVDYSKVVNEQCGVESSKEVTSVELRVASTTVSGGVEDAAGPHLTLILGPTDMSWGSFVSEGWSRLRGTLPQPLERIPVRELVLRPLNIEQEQFLSIDNEEFEVKPMKIAVLPKSLNVFQPRPNCFTPTKPR